MRKPLLTLLALAALAFLSAQVPVSLRYHALGTAIDGEWEHIYDPIELNFYDQTYYFTNLTDYAQQVSLYEDDVEFLEENGFFTEFPFGFTFRNPFWKSLKHSLLLRFKDNQIPDLFADYGEAETVTANYYDTDDDHIYDIRAVTVERETDYDDVSSRLYVLLNSTLPLGDKVFGFRLSRDGRKDRWDEAAEDVDLGDWNSYWDGFYAGDHSQFYGYTTTEIASGDVLHDYSEDGEFETVSSSTDYELLLSLMQPSSMCKGNSELRFDLSLLSANDGKVATTDSYEAMSFQDYGSGTIDRHFQQDFTREFSLPQTELFFAARLRHNLDSQPLRLRQSFTEFSLGLGGFMGDYEDSTVKEISAVEMDDGEFEDGYQTFGNLASSVATGSQKGLRARLSGRSSVYFSDNVCFGFGAALDMRTFDRQSDNEYLLHEVTYNQAGDEFDDSSDYLITENQSYAYAEELTQTVWTATFPVGLEFSIPGSSLTDHDAFSLRNFTFRAGTLFTHQVISGDARRVLDEETVQINTVIAEYGDGTVIETHPTDNEFANFQEKATESHGSKRFTAGLGYRHSANLDIDMGAWIDPVDESYFLGLMFTVRK